MKVETNSKRKSLPPKLIIKLGKFVWVTLWHTMMSKLAPRNTSGEYIRPSSYFRNFVRAETDNQYLPAANRYSLIVGMSCPWAHRTLVVRALKGLEQVLQVTIVYPSPIEGVGSSSGSMKTVARLLNCTSLLKRAIPDGVRFRFYGITRLKLSLTMRAQKLS